MSETDAEIEARIRARMDADMADPEWRESMRRSMDDVHAGRVIPWKLGPIDTLLLPRWATWLLFRVAPFTWGRRMRKYAADAALHREEEGESR